MIFDPTHNLFLTMQTTLNNTARDLLVERQAKLQAMKMVDDTAAALSAVATERDTLKAENNELKKPSPPTKPASAGVLVSGDDHL